MENNNWLQSKVSSIEDTIKSYDKDFSNIPTYKKGKETGGFIGSLIDALVDMVCPSK